MVINDLRVMGWSSKRGLNYLRAGRASKSFSCYFTKKDTEILGDPHHQDWLYLDITILRIPYWRWIFSHFWPWHIHGIHMDLPHDSTKVITNLLPNCPGHVNAEFFGRVEVNVGPVRARACNPILDRYIISRQFIATFAQKKGSEK